MSPPTASGFGKRDISMQWPHTQTQVFVRKEEEEMGFRWAIKRTATLSQMLSVLHFSLKIQIASPCGSRGAAHLSTHPREEVQSDRDNKTPGTGTATWPRSQQPWDTWKGRLLFHARLAAMGALQTPSAEVARSTRPGGPARLSCWEPANPTWCFCHFDRESVFTGEGILIHESISCMPGVELSIRPLWYPSGPLKLHEGRHRGACTTFVKRLGRLPCGVGPRWHSRTLSWRWDPRPLDSPLHPDTSRNIEGLRHGHGAAHSLWGPLS